MPSNMEQCSQHGFTVIFLGDCTWEDVAQTGHANVSVGKELIMLVGPATENFEVRKICLNVCICFNFLCYLTYIYIYAVLWNFSVRPEEGSSICRVASVSVKSLYCWC